MFRKNNIARGVVVGEVVLFLLFGFFAQAYSTDSKATPTPAVSSSSFDLKNIFAPNFNLPVLASNSVIKISSHGLSYQDLTGWWDVHGGILGVVVYVLNIFLEVLQALRQIAGAIVGHLKQL